MEAQSDQDLQAKFTAADLGALAHLYPGELQASAVPMLLASWIVAAFLFFEARRYLYTFSAKAYPSGSGATKCADDLRSRG